MRTPKVRNRTVPAFIYVVLPYALVAFSAYTFLRAYHDHEWTNVVFAGVNAILGCYAIVAFIGIRHSLVDIWVNVVSWLYKPQRHAPTPARRLPEPDRPRPRAEWRLGARALSRLCRPPPHAESQAAGGDDDPDRPARRAPAGRTSRRANAVTEPRPRAGAEPPADTRDQLLMRERRALRRSDAGNGRAAPHGARAAAFAVSWGSPCTSRSICSRLRFLVSGTFQAKKTIAQIPKNAYSQNVSA